MPQPETVLITGATGGIGGALAAAYAAPGVTLALQGRNQDRLAEVARGCEALGAKVLTRAFDLRDRAGARSLAG
jgi:NADP-dependent 3-hydroxy acid dehydrogenase YdfG